MGLVRFIILKTQQNRIPFIEKESARLFEELMEARRIHLEPNEWAPFLRKELPSS